MVHPIDRWFTIYVIDFCNPLAAQSIPEAEEKMLNTKQGA